MRRYCFGSNHVSPLRQCTVYILCGALTLFVVSTVCQQLLVPFLSINHFNSKTSLSNTDLQAEFGWIRLFVGLETLQLLPSGHCLLWCLLYVAFPSFPPKVTCILLSVHHVPFAPPKPLVLSTYCEYLKHFVCSLFVIRSESRIGPPIASGQRWIGLYVLRQLERRR